MSKPIGTYLYPGFRGPLAWWKAWRARRRQRMCARIAVLWAECEAELLAEIERPRICCRLGEKLGEAGESLFWSNSQGWVTREGADLFTEKEIDILRLPLDGEWDVDGVEH